MILGYIRGLFVMGMGWALMKIVNRVLLNAQAQSERIQDPKPRSNYALEMQPCPRCGVYTTQPCSNPDCGV